MSYCTTTELFKLKKSAPTNRDWEVPPTIARINSCLHGKGMPFPYNQGARLVEAIHELPLIKGGRDREVPPKKGRLTESPLQKNEISKKSV